MFLDQKICVLERFMKDYVTLKSGVMTAGYSALTLQE